MTVEEVYKVLKKLDMDGECLEGRIGNCELKVGKSSLSIGGITYTFPKKR